jgi:hypothetical protein
LRFKRRLLPRFTLGTLYLLQVFTLGLKRRVPV